MEKTILFEEEILKALQSYPSNTPTAFYFILAIGYLLIAAGICFIAASVMFNRNEYWPFMAYIATGVYIVLMGVEPPIAPVFYGDKIRDIAYPSGYNRSLFLLKTDETACCMITEREYNHARDMGFLNYSKARAQYLSSAIDNDMEYSN